MFCINTFEREDRYNACMSEFAHHGMDVTFIRTNRHEIGAWGCFRAHVAAWEACLASEEEYGLIMEDDIVLTPHFVSYLEQMRQNLHDQKGFDIIHLGGMTSFRRPCALLNLCHCRHLLATAYLVRADFIRAELPRLRMIANTESYFKDRSWPLHIDLYLDRAFHHTQYATVVPLVHQRTNRSDNTWNTMLPHLNLSSCICWPTLQNSACFSTFAYCCAWVLIDFPKELFSIQP